MGELWKSKNGNIGHGIYGNDKIEWSRILGKKKQGR